MAFIFIAKHLILRIYFFSSRSVTDFDPDFVWNEFLSEPFSNIGLRKWCIVLLQGMATSSQLTINDIESNEINLKSQFVSDKSDLQNNKKINKNQNLNKNSNNNIKKQ
eukprot:Anaeramoba_flamelloidesa327553_6.p1 GENE.a327553_6~~a327553_6.p1  ORF type:complete len:108 (-),score=20.31 a327553_6:14-337(-)